MPHALRTLGLDPKRFAYTFSQLTTKTGLEQFVVTLFSPEEFDQGPVPGRRQLVEYVPVNMHERWFGLKDMDLTETSISKDERGKPTLLYQFKAGQVEAFSDFTAEYIGVESALIVRGYIVSIPFYASRITGAVGQIAGLSEKELQALVEGIRQALPR